MSQTKAQLVGGVGFSTADSLTVHNGLAVTGVVTATSFEGNITGNATGLTGSPSIVVTDITASGNVTIGGTLTYEDVTNIDSIGIVTARSGVHFGLAGVGGSVSGAGNANFAGIVTATSFSGDVTGTASNASGATGDFSIADKIVHTGDTNTAIRFPAADTFTVETAGSEAIRVDSSQRLLVGSTSARANFNNGTRTAYLQLEGTLGTNIDSSSLALVYNQDSTGNASNIYFGKSRGSSNGDNTALNATDDRLGNITFQGNDGTQFVDAAHIRAFTDGTPGADDMPGRLVFSTNSGTTSPTEALRVDSDQIVSVNNPNAIYSSSDNFVVHEVDAGARIGFQRQDTGQVTTGVELGALSFYSNDGDLNPSARILVQADGAHAAGDKPGRIVFSTVPDGSATMTERLRITAAGNMGLGSNSPSTRLHVKPASDVTTDGIRVQRQADDGQFLLLNYFGGTGQVAAVDTAGSSPILRFTRSTDNSTYTESARIDSSGRLLLGTTSGTGKFIVQDSSLPKIQSNFNGTKHLEMGVGGSGGGLSMTTGHFLTINHQPYANRGSDANLTERFRIGPSGQIGLGGANYGTSGQVLTSNGSSSAPTWQDAAGGAWNLIQTVNASGASTVNLTGIDNTYSSYCIKITDATIVPGSSGRMFFAQFMTGSTPSVPSAAGFYAYSEQYQNTPTMGDNLGSTTINYSRTWEMYGFQNPGDSFMQRIAGGDYVSLSNEIGDSENHTSIELHIMNPGEAYGNHAFWWHTHQQETNPTSTRFEARHLQGEGWHIMDTSDPSDTTGAAITGVRFTISRNNLDNGTVTGKFQLYGMS